LARRKSLFPPEWPQNVTDWDKGMVVFIFGTEECPSRQIQIEPGVGCLSLLRSARARVSFGRSMSLDSPKPKPVDAAPLRIAVAASRYNERLIEALLARVLAGLRAGGVKDRNLALERVPGSNELPVAARLLAGRRRPDAIIALGVIIRGDTLHYELIAEASANALQQVALSMRIPVINGIVVAESQAQAEERCLGRTDRGSEFAQAAIEMAAFKRRLAR